MSAQLSLSTLLRTVGSAKRWAAICAVLSLIIGLPDLYAAASDAAQSSYPSLRRIELKGTPADGFAVVALPPELTSTVPAGSYRLLRSDGREVPYVVTHDAPESKERRYSGQLIDTRHEPEQTIWVVDLGSIRRFESLELSIPQHQFRRRVTVEASDEPGGPFRTIARDVGVFDLPWQNAPGGRLHYTTLRLPKSERARFLRFQISTRFRYFRPLSLQGVTALSSLSRPGSQWTMNVPLGPMPSPPIPKHAKDDEHLSLYRLEVPSDLAFLQLQLSARDLGFVRSVRLLEADGLSSQLPHQAKLKVLAEGTLFRIADGPIQPATKKTDKKEPIEPIDDEPVTGENLTLSLDDAPGRGVIILEIANGDNPPLSELQVTVSGYGSRLIFPVSPVGKGSSTEQDSQYTLFYGSETARVRDYDLAKLTGSLAKLSTLLPATLGPKEANPRYHKPQPLPAVPTTGSPLETTSFRMQRPVLMSDGVELYSLLLSPIDLAFLRPDLGDLRVVDASNQQVPYVLVPHDLETRTELRISAEPSAATDKISRYRLSLLHQGQSQLVPMDALELTVSSSFYRRSVRVREAKSEATPYANVLCSATILRLSEEDAGLHRLPLPGHPVKELILEVDNGDNPALDIPQVLGVVTVPRVIYKGDAQNSYRLLLGNPSVGSPSYDLASLSQVLVEYPSKLASLGELAPNSAYRPPGNYFQEGRMNWVLLGVLLLCVVVLLGLSIRLVRAPHQASDGESPSERPASPPKSEG
jgi:hypothetical protein